MDVMKPKLYASKTPAGRPKIVDSYGFSIATGTDGTRESHERIERLVLCWNILSHISTWDLEDIASGKYRIEIVNP